MDSNDENPRRNPHRPEDNPFIAFRRYADSQVSSLLNSVFAIPATIANYNHAHRAREQCLFGKADKKQCDQLHELETAIADLRHEGRELFRSGDMQAVLKNSERLMSLDRQADNLRRSMVESSDSKAIQKLGGQEEAALVERVGNEKGQEWGWSWDWGFPRPFDDNQDTEHRESRQMERLRRMQAEFRDEFNEKKFDQAMNELMQAFFRMDEQNERSTREWENAVARTREDTHGEDGHDPCPRVWSWSRSWQWPPPSDAQQARGSGYSPMDLEEDPEMQRAGVPWQKAYEELLRAEEVEKSNHTESQDSQHTEHHRRRRFCNRRRWGHHEDQDHKQNAKVEPTQASESMDESGYEYAHDHEDQHDDPPTPKIDQNKRPFGFGKPKQTEAPETEMDAYEQLLQTKESAPQAQAISQSAILSTLTTTERTVASDGSITTKTVLKKRFADGREESSETVQTQHGRDTPGTGQDAWRSKQLQAPLKIEEEKPGSRKGSGWFWSS